MSAVRFHPAPRSFLRALCALGLAFVGSCVEVQTFYRDAPPVTPDTPGVDAPREDAPLEDGAVDARVMIGADATRAVLASIGERVVLASLRDFVTRAEALEQATLAASTGGEVEREAARTAWREAMASWQRIEMLQLGPAGLPSVTLGGLALRDEIDGWPLLTRCRIDQGTAAPDHADPSLLSTVPINGRGLAAIEYLLFYPTSDNGCSATAEINASGTWSGFGDAEITRRREVHAHSLSVLVLARATELETAWDPAGGNFLGQLATAGAGSTTYASAQLGLNAVSDALVFLYREVVDYKLGIPAGLRLECTTDTCPEQVESRWAGASLPHIRANLEAFRDAYLGAPEGTEGAGFDDLLRSIGATELDARLQAQIATAFAAMDNVDGALEVAVLTDHADVVALHDALRVVADTFRVEVVSVLDLQPSMRIEGDND